MRNENRVENVEEDSQQRWKRGLTPFILLNWRLADWSQDLEPMEVLLLSRLDIYLLLNIFSIHVL